MSLESTLYTALSGNAALTALVGTRIVPDDRKQGLTLPCVSYTRVSTQRRQGFGATQAVIVSRPRIQFSCWALTKEEARSVCAALRTALLALSLPVTLENETTMRDPDTNYARRNLDAFIGHAGE